MNLGKIFNAFPPPRFLDIRYAGLSISDSAIRCVEFTTKKKSLHIRKYKEVKLAPGAIVGGTIVKKEEVVQVLRDLKKDLSLEYVKVSLPEEKGYLFTAKIPIVSETEVLSAIESKIEENVPVSPTELSFDHKLIDHSERGHLDVVVSTMPTTVVDSYADAVESAGLIPIALEVESQAVIRALISKDSRETTSLILHFNDNKVGFYVESDRVVRFTSTIPLSKEVSESPELIWQEIKKIYIYWHTLKENLDKLEKKISYILVCGENIPKDVAPYLSAHGQTPAELGNVWINVFDLTKRVPEISFSESLKYAAAVGLALPSEILI